MARDDEPSGRWGVWSLMIFCLAIYFTAGTAYALFAVLATEPGSLERTATVIALPWIACCWPLYAGRRLWDWWKQS